MSGLPFRRVLVANRGEIALRVVRACHELGAEAVAVYSDADAGAAHVRSADIAVRLGPAPVEQSYLRADRLVEIAVATAADAVHPGYGFLSERASFAAAVEAAGITFVGPSPASIDALGDKVAARRLAQAAGVPVVAGTTDPVSVDSAEQRKRAASLAEEIGFPLLVKAAAGGGGRGMRQVDRASDLPAALETAAREALAAFGEGTVYLERLISRPRHVEVQLVGDGRGGVVAIGERDCSLQRRHQKLIEEAPAPGLTVEERATVHELAVRMGRSANLRNAATVEFLYEGEGRFWFLEVNTRLQVEHGVTELVTGLDLVHEQLRLAAGEPLSDAVVEAAANATHPLRHSIEARLSAEDPARSFVPTPGQVKHWRMPAGPGVRVDTAIERGSIVPPEYDPLIAKLMVVAEDRPTALARLCRVASEVEVAGVQTTLPFIRFVAGSESFAAGSLSTSWLEDNWDGAAERRRAVRVGLLAAALAASDVDAILAAPRTVGPGSANEPVRSDGSSAWRLAGRPGAERGR